MMQKREKGVRGIGTASRQKTTDFAAALDVLQARQPFQRSPKAAMDCGSSSTTISTPFASWASNSACSRRSPRPTSTPRRLASCYCRGRSVGGGPATHQRPQCGPDAAYCSQRGPRRRAKRPTRPRSGRDRRARCATMSGGCRPVRSTGGLSGGRRQRPSRRRSGVDNEKTAVSRGAGAGGTINPSYRRYAARMKFHVDACAPRQPQRTGKVERRVRDQRPVINPCGRGFRDLAELQAWTDARSVARRCPATGTTVAEAWAEECRLLTPVPETVPEPLDLVRVVGRDGLVAFEGRQYGVPFRLVGATVEVRGIAGAVQVQGLPGRRLHIPAGPNGGSSSTSATTRARVPSG